MGSWHVLGGGHAVVWALWGQKGVKKRLSAWSQNRGCGRLKKTHPNSVRRGQKVLLQRVTFFYRACAGFAWWVSQRTPAGQILVVGSVVVGHRRYARWGRASAARALFTKPPGPPPKPPAGCAGEPCRGQYVLGGGRAVVWAPQGPKGAKKNLSAWPQGQGCGKLKNIRPIRLEGVKRYSSSASHFFTGRVRVLHGGCRSAPQRARFGSWALWWSAIADMHARAGQVRPGPSPQSPRSPSQLSPQPAVQANRVAVSPGKGLTSTLAPHQAHTAEACQNIPALPVLTNHPYLLNNTSIRPGRRLLAWIRVF